MNTKLTVFVSLQIALASMLVIDSFSKDIISRSILTILIGILFVVLFICYKFKPDDRHNYKDALYTVIIIGSAYYIFIYLLGLFTGFYDNSQNLNFSGVFWEILRNMLFILTLELFRYVVISSEFKNKWVLALLVIVLTLCDVSDSVYKCNLKDISDTVYLVGYSVLPSLLKNVALTYLAIKSSYKVTIVYRLIFELPMLFLPIVPALGEYFNCILSVILPVIVFSYAYFHYGAKNKKFFVSRKRNRYIGRIAGGVIVVLAAIIVGLVSGFFKYYVIAVGSGSMSTEIEKGDLVFVKKLNKDEIRTLKEGNIMVFNYSGIVLVHRITKIYESDEGLSFRTKGDANAEEDSFPTLEENVIGAAIGKIPKIGVPTVWLKELSNF